MDNENSGIEDYSNQSIVYEGYFMKPEHEAKVCEDGIGLLR